MNKKLGSQNAVTDTTIVGLCRKRGTPNKVVVSIGGWMPREEMEEAEYALAVDKQPQDYTELPWCSDTSAEA